MLYVSVAGSARISYQYLREAGKPGVRLMKKTIRAVALVPSLLVASSMAFASDGAALQLSDVNDSLRQSVQEQKDFHGQPGQQPRPGWQPGHPGQPIHPGPHPQPFPGPQPYPPPPQPWPQPHPQPPAPVDTAQAYNDGIRDGAQRGTWEGRQQGYSDGVNAGEMDGRRRGTDDADTAGRQAGYNDGYNVDQSAATQKGNSDGQNTGAANGAAAGQKRCYDEGYTSGYNPAYAAAKQAGEQDAVSYNAGFAKGQTDAAVTEAHNGQKAGYQAGFSQRETELQGSLAGMPAARAVFAGSDLTRGELTGLPIELVRNGYSTPQEQQAYQQGYQQGYRNAYQQAYDDAKLQGYNERYQNAYSQAYNAQYSISYGNGYTEGKDKGYQEAYNSAYNSAYNESYGRYSKMEYSDRRAQGLSEGKAAGQKDGFTAGSAEQAKRGYNDGYQKKAAEVYPGAFTAGKQAGVAAADKYYHENAVLKVSGIGFYDENGNGKFEADENVMMKAEISNYGFQPSDAVSITVKSERGEITLVPNLQAAGVGGRAKTAVNLAVGKLYDVVAPDADTLYVTFSLKGQPVGDYQQAYARTNANKVGVVGKDGADVTKKATWFFPGKITSLNRGDKVIITAQQGSYYKVRKSDVAAGSWTEGYIKSDKLSLQ